MSTYRRLVLDLYHGASDAQTLRVAAELARLMHLDLHCLFIEDEAVHALAALPFAREIRLPAHVWSPIDADTLAAEMRDAAVRARRALDEVITGLGVTREFEVLRGDPAACVAGICRSDDILVVSEPAAQARAAHGTRRRRGVAHETVGSVLLLPLGVSLRKGPVVAVLADAADGALDVACAIANAAGERVAVVCAGEAASERVAERAEALGRGERLILRQTRGEQADDVLHVLGNLKERLIVMSRGGLAAGDTASASRIATQRGVPLLLMEWPASASPSPEAEPRA